MKFISRYNKLRVVLMASQRQIEEIGGDKEVIIKPPVVAEFDGGLFDTAKAFPRLNQIQADAGFPKRMATEEQLCHLLKGHPDFKTLYNEFHEESPEEILARKREELADLEQQYGLDAQVDEMANEGQEGNDEPQDGPADKTPETEDQQDPGVPQTNNEQILPRDQLERMDYKALQGYAGKILGISPVGKSREMLVDALETERLDREAPSQAE